MNRCSINPNFQIEERPVFRVQSQQPPFLRKLDMQQDMRIVCKRGGETSIGGGRASLGFTRENRAKVARNEKERDRM